jgi:hypothetical protein
MNVNSEASLTGLTSARKLLYQGGLRPQGLVYGGLIGLALVPLAFSEIVVIIFARVYILSPLKI